MEEAMSVLGAALRYRSMGFSVIPLLRNDKRPAIKTWEPYQKKIASEEEAIEWFSGADRNLGVVTGEISNLLVVDCDTPEAVEQIEKMMGGLNPPTQITPRGGRHYFFRYEKGFISKRISEGVDVKTIGGYVVVYPSALEIGKWNWIDGRSIFDILPSYMGNNFTELLRAMAGGGQSRGRGRPITSERIPVNTTAMFHGGQLDEDLFSVANALVKGGMFPEQVQKTLEAVAQYGNSHRDGRPPFTAQDVAIKVQSALQRAERKEINLSQEIRDWVSIAPGTFEMKDIERALHLNDINDYKTIWSILNKLKLEGVIESAGTRRGLYRTKQNEFEVMNFEEADREMVNLSWPFGIEKMYRCYPGSIAVLAGAPASGKTTFCLNFCLRNLDKQKVTYLSSELGTQELGDRLGLFPVPRDTWKRVTFKKASANFEDAIDPDGVNIIDYLELYDELWKMALHMKNINTHLRSGMALIALQRPYTREVAKGGEATLEKPRIYLTLSQPPGELHKLKIIKCHNWMNPSENPRGKVMRFRIYRGHKLENDGVWEREEEELNPMGFKDFSGRRR